MDWGQMMIALSTGVGAVLGFQKILRGFRDNPRKPLVNGERQTIIEALQRLERSAIAQNRTIGVIEGRLNDMGDRVLTIERAFGRGQTRPQS